MEEYSKYKDSGVKWIGDIPKHWEVKKLRNLISMTSVKNHPNETLLSVVREQGVIVRDIEADDNHNFIPEDLSGYKLIEEGQFVINKMKAWQGSYAVSGYRGIVSPAYYTCDLRLAYKTFFNIAIRSCAYVPFFTQYSKGIRVGQWDLSPVGLKEIPFFLPPLAEQHAIVSYLDSKVGQIDTYVTKQTQQIELLKELKQAVIANAVTKGIGKNSHKPSGVSWLGDVPDHWKLRKIKYVFAERSEKGYPEEPVLCSTQKYGVIPQHMYESRVVVVNKGLEGLKLVRKGDFVISLRSFQGGIEYAHYQGIISAAYTILKLNDGFDAEYMKYLMKSYNFIQLLQTCVTGIREGQNINYSLLKKNFLPIPPLSEQRAIVSYIEAKTASINMLIDAYEQQVERIKEYKQRLISDAVTGKINVTGKQTQTN